MDLPTQDYIETLNRGLEYLSRVYDRLSHEDKGKVYRHQLTVKKVDNNTHPAILINLIDLTHLYLDEMNPTYDAEVEEFLIMIQEKYD